jgi:superfamily II DNA/RNA helicase
MAAQQLSLEEIPHVIVATPGRIRALLKTHHNLNKYIANLSFLILDEADRLLETNICSDVIKV